LASIIDAGSGSLEDRLKRFNRHGGPLKAYVFCVSLGNFDVELGDGKQTELHASLATFRNFTKEMKDIPCILLFTKKDIFITKLRGNIEVRIFDAFYCSSYHFLTDVIDWINLGCFEGQLEPQSCYDIIEKEFVKNFPWSKDKLFIAISDPINPFTKLMDGIKKFLKQQTFDEVLSWM